MSRVHSDAQQLETIFAFYLNKFCLDNIPDSQTHITKQPIHDDQVLNIGPARLVHLSQNLNSLAKQITTHKSRTIFFSFFTCLSCSESMLVSKQFNTRPAKYYIKKIQFNPSNYNSNHAPRVRFNPNHLALAHHHSGQILQAINTHTINSKFAFYPY